MLNVEGSDKKIKIRWQRIQNVSKIICERKQGLKKRRYLWASSPTIHTLKVKLTDKMLLYEHHNIIHSYSLTRSAHTKSVRSEDTPGERTWHPTGSHCKKPDPSFFTLLGGVDVSHNGDPSATISFVKLLHFICGTNTSAVLSKLPSRVSNKAPCVFPPSWHLTLKSSRSMTSVPLTE